jgi:hypothetical protein
LHPLQHAGLSRRTPDRPSTASNSREVTSEVVLLVSVGELAIYQQLRTWPCVSTDHSRSPSVGEAGFSVELAAHNLRDVVINQFALPHLPGGRWRTGQRRSFGCCSDESHSILSWPCLEAR